MEACQCFSLGQAVQVGVLFAYAAMSCPVLLVILRVGCLLKPQCDSRTDPGSFIMSLPANETRLSHDTLSPTAGMITVF